MPEDGAEHRGAARAGGGGAARGHVGKSVRIPVSLSERSHSSRASGRSRLAAERSCP
jgi:hypothetical protein